MNFYSFAFNKENIVLMYMSMEPMKKHKEGKSMNVVETHSYQELEKESKKNDQTPMYHLKMYL